MTDDETKELRRAVAYAKKIHDKGEDPPDGNALIQGALIRAVELLAADQFRDVAEKIEATNEAQAYPDELVERLAERLWGHRSGRVPGSPQWKELDTGPMAHIKPSLRADARAVLSELAKAPMELPNEDDLAKLLGYQPGHNASTVIAACRARIAPMIAAMGEEIRALKSARITAEEEQEAQSMARTKLKTRIAELEGTVVHHRDRVTFLKTRIVELEKRIAEQDATQAQMAAWRESERTKARTEIDAANARIAELETGFDYGILEATRNQRDIAEKRIAELTTQVIVDGKTPGQTARIAWYGEDDPDNESEDILADWENAGRAVVRVHGGEALRRVRNKIEQFRIDSGAARKTSTAQFAASDALENACSIVGNELAELGQSSDKPARQLRHKLDGCALFENFAGRLRLLGFVVAKPAAVDWIEVGGILNEVIDLLTKPEVERRE